MGEKLSSLTDMQVAKRVKDSANQIWLAGLGAYAKAEAEGSRLFELLVKDGEEVESSSKGQIESQISAAKEKAKEKVEEVKSGVKSRATGSWERVEKAFDDRVSRALKRLNIPTKGDVEQLSSKIDVLNTAIEKLVQAKAKPQAKARPAAKAAATKTTKTQTKARSTASRKKTTK